MFLSNCSYKGVFLKKIICARIPLLIIAANTVQIDAMTLSTELRKRFVGQVQKIAFVIHWRDTPKDFGVYTNLTSLQA
jgi:hypothetical protein